MYSFHNITIADKEEVDRIRRENKHILSSHAFTSLFLWNYNLHLKIYTEEDFFVVKRDYDYYFPCGNENKKRQFIEEIIIPCKSLLMQMTQEDVDFINLNYPNAFSIEADRDESEYIYLTSQQAELKGSKFSSMRKKIRHATGAEAYSFEKIGAEHFDILKKMTYEWNEMHSPQKGVLYGDSYPSLVAIDYYNQLDLSGVIMFANENPVAYIIGAGISDDTYDIHIAKCLVKDSGVDLYCKQKFYSQIKDDFLYINREDDMGIGGLREVKMEAHPIHLNNVMKGIPL